MPWRKVILWTLILLIPCGIYNDHMGLFSKLGAESNSDGERMFVVGMLIAVLITYWDLFVTKPIRYLRNHDKLLSKAVVERSHKRARWIIYIGLSPLAVIFALIPFMVANDAWKKLPERDREDFRTTFGFSQNQSPPATHRGPSSR